MKSSPPPRIRDTVYVIGAGFFQGLGYPLTKSLLIDEWDQLPEKSRDQLRKIIEFHHPEFKPDRLTSFPDIEQLLTDISVNLQMWNASRPADGRFTTTQLTESREILLFTIAAWFHNIYETGSQVAWLSQIVKRLRHENAAIISFNWDLILDHLLFKGDLDSQKYGLTHSLEHEPVLLKPHGSLNWYRGTQLDRVPGIKRIEIFHSKDALRRVHAFLRPRGVKSKSGKRYTPLIIPPTYFKEFRPTVFKRLWQHCTDVLSTPKRLVFLGYSLPPADLHAQFILRCGFHNQLNGRIKDSTSRYPATGPAEVTIVNPDPQATRRLEAVAGSRIPCTWVPKRVEDWIGEDS